ncbi:glycine oxidase ThiO [Aquisalinus flavus]|uniref:Glycine oxidase ThiO n=1 Tax=Aquisalinus flavus TaxID=1526572 RepID=A0A8J2V1M5_9PROT|nr:glycine oxidase ThiO [Aquisalinus flavus]MBD0427513.1 glycine oxidase ThiO [Aquisalinus flavus]UNE47308.1 glycine oxidase ThiO [Aquisalinus flavus]GGD01565.1 glycine oxidase ThiO [Aquisalinus flavus]
MHADIVIIGGGLIGLAIAHRLAGDGADVCLIEAGQPGAGTTSAAAGMLCPGFELAHFAAEKQESFHRFAMASLAGWREMAPALAEATGIHIDLRMSGALGLAANEKELAGFSTLAGRLSDFGRRPVMLSRDELDQLQPGLHERFRGALYLADEGQVDPRLAATSMVAACEAMGVRIIGQTNVTGLDKEGDRVTAVTTGDGERVAAGQVIAAAGLASRNFWLEPGPAPFFSIKGQALSLAAGAAGLACVIRTSGTYLCPKADGRLVVGATEERDIETLTTDEDRLDSLYEGAAAIAPGLKECAVTGAWAGLRPTTPDRLPVIGRSLRVRNLIYAGGHHRNGILLAPATARLVAAIAGGAGNPALTAPDRFAG